MSKPPIQFGTPATSGASNSPFGASQSPFGQNTSASTGGLFGNVGATPTTSGPSSSSLFGLTSGPGQTASLFGRGTMTSGGSGTATPSFTFGQQQDTAKTS